MKEIKIKIIDGYIIEKLRGKVFIAKQSSLCARIKYFVSFDGVHVKTKHEGKAIPNEFFVEV
jgi:hypothetical protein